jgi:hypothetical protein
VALPNKTNTPPEPEKAVKPLDLPLRLGAQCWRWLRTNGSAIMLFLAMAAIVGNIAMTSSRLGTLENTINGEDGLTEQVRGLRTSIAEMNKMITRLDRTVQALDKYVLDQLKAKAALILGTSDVSILRTYVPSHESGCAPSSPSSSSPSSRREMVFTYCIEEIKDEMVVVRARADEESDGKIVKSVGDQRIPLRLPPTVGERVSYDLKPNDIKLVDGSTVSFPLVHFEFALLERYGPDEVTIAATIAETGEKQLWHPTTLAMSDGAAR